MTKSSEQPARLEDFERNVFINCPFDDAYLVLLRPLSFVVVYFGYRPRLASESSDSGENRLAKICRLIHSSRYSIHDLSLLKSTMVDEFARMNMPFELGIDFGTRLHGSESAATKRFLILGEKPHDFKRALSDLSGVDIKHHDNDPFEITWAARDWFYETVGEKKRFEGAKYWADTISGRYQEFIQSLFDARTDEGHSEDQATRAIRRMPMIEWIDATERWVSTYNRAHAG